MRYSIDVGRGLNNLESYIKNNPKSKPCNIVDGSIIVLDEPIIQDEKKADVVSESISVQDSVKVIDNNPITNLNKPEGSVIPGVSPVPTIPSNLSYEDFKGVNNIPVAPVDVPQPNIQPIVPTQPKPESYMDFSGLKNVRIMNSDPVNVVPDTYTQQPMMGSPVQQVIEPQQIISGIPEVDRLLIPYQEYKSQHGLYMNNMLYKILMVVNHETRPAIVDFRGLVVNNIPKIFLLTDSQFIDEAKAISITDYLNWDKFIKTGTVDVDIISPEERHVFRYCPNFGSKIPMNEMAEFISVMNTKIIPYMNSLNPYLTVLVEEYKSPNNFTLIMSNDLPSRFGSTPHDWGGTMRFVLQVAGVDENGKLVSTATLTLPKSDADEIANANKHPENCTCGCNDYKKINIIK